MSLGTYFVQQLTLVKKGYQVNPDSHLLCVRNPNFGDVDILNNEISHSYGSKASVKKSKIFEC